MPRLICWKDCASPYPRAGLWYVSYQGKLWEAWAQSPDGERNGPKDLFDGEFKMYVIGRTRGTKDD